METERERTCKELNAERAERGAKLMGLYETFDAGEASDCASWTDMIADILHAASDAGHDAVDIHQSALTHFEAEQGEEAEEEDGQHEEETPSSTLQRLASIEGNVTIRDGIATTESGETVNLLAFMEIASNMTLNGECPECKRPGSEPNPECPEHREYELDPDDTVHTFGELVASARKTLKDFHYAPRCAKCGGAALIPIADMDADGKEWAYCSLECRDRH
jgi:hypothetical protein